MKAKRIFPVFFCSAAAVALAVSGCSTTQPEERETSGFRITRHRPPRTVQAPAAPQTAQDDALLKAFDAGIEPFKREMAAGGLYSPAELDELFNGMTPSPTVIRLMTPRPYKRKNYHAYRRNMVEKTRIKRGLAFMEKYADELARAERETGVPAEIITAIIGVETVYGRTPTTFPILRSLATLAFAYPEAPNKAERQAYFRGELKAFLELAKTTGYDPKTRYGSFAGAYGASQFMPTSIRAHAVDFDRDGVIDLRHSMADAIGSTANFLRNHGWVRGGPIYYPATPAQNIPLNEAVFGHGKKAIQRIADIKAAGLVTDAPEGPLYGAVDLPCGETTEYVVGAHNFFVITCYNRSYFYAMAVTELAEALKANRDA